MKKIAIAALLSSFVAAPAFAADEGFYVGVKAGSATKKVGGLSESNTAYGLFGGYAFNPNVAVEVAYTDLGTMVLGLTKFSAIDASVVGTYPINQSFSVFGKLGVASTQEKLLGLSGSRTAATFGLGGQFNVNQSIGIRLGFDRYSFGDNVIFNRGDVNMYSVAGVFKF